MLGRRLDPADSLEIRHGLTAVTIARTGSNAVSRYLGPFVATVAAGLDVSVGQLGVGIAVAEGCGVVGPLLGGLSDRIDRRRAMVIGLGLGSLGALLLSVSPLLPGPAVAGFTVALVLFTLAKIFYDVSVGAWIADRIPFDRRGRVIGLIETSWALGLLVGVSIMGLITELADWRWAYAAGAAWVALAAVAVQRRLRPTPTPAAEIAAAAGGAEDAEATEDDDDEVAGSASEVVADGQHVALVDGDPARDEARTAHLPPADGRAPAVVPSPSRALGLPAAGWFAIATMFAICAASQAVFITFGAWLQDDRGFSDAGVAAVTFGLGALELCAAALSSARTDRWGKERSVTASTAVMLAAAGAAALATGSTAIGLTLVICFIAAFEFSIISLLPIGGELVPGRPGAGLGLFLAATATSRAAVTIPATQLYESIGFAACTVLALALCGVAVAAITARRRLLTPA